MKPPMLPPGFVILKGRQGVGKTSLAVSMILNDYKYHNRERLVTARTYMDAFQEQNPGRKLTLGKSLYFTNIRVLLNARKGLTTYFTDTQRLALPNEDFPVQYFPYGSVVFIQEADTQLFNRNYKDTSDYLVALLKYVRHNGMTILFDTQRDSALDLAVRKLATEVWHVISSGYKRFLFFKPRYRWDYLRIQNQLNEAVKDFAAIGVHMKLNVVSRAHAKYKGNVFNHYDSYSGRAYFLDGIRDYEYLPHPRMSFNAYDIARYCALHPLTKPKETRKSERKHEKETD